MARRVIVSLAASAIAAALGGCAIGQLVGGMAASHARTGSHDVESKYSGLVGKNYAVVIYADRVIQADFPEVVGDLTVTIAERLADPAHKVGAAGYVPGDRVLQYQYNNPRWVVMPWRDLAKEMAAGGRIVFELPNFRLADPATKTPGP